MEIRTRRAVAAAWVLATCLFAHSAWSGASGASTQDASDTGATISIVERIKIATEIRAAVDTYFAHWQTIPAEDFDADYNAYLKKITQTDDRRAFDKATLALFATLHNGHTDFHDAWLSDHSGGPTGLRVAHRGGRWIVLRSERSTISPGDILTTIDGQPIDSFYDQQKRYIAASSERARVRHLFITPYLFPKRFTLGLQDGRSVTLDRSTPLSRSRPSADTPADTDWPDGVYYHSIASFDDPTYEKAAVAFIKAHRDARLLVIDVRGNGGGSTPVDLIHAVVLKSYLSMSQASAMSVGLLAAYGQFADSPAVVGHPGFQAMAEGMKSYFSRPMMYWPGTLQPPHDPIYRQHLIVLTDAGCASACEDFVMPLKATHRATIIGDTTYGSTGQPFVKTYDNGMSFRVGAKRESFGDGRPFEGVGIQPDIKILPSAADLAAGRDPVMAKARALARDRSTVHGAQVSAD